MGMFSEEVLQVPHRKNKIICYDFLNKRVFLTWGIISPNTEKITEVVLLFPLQKACSFKYSNYWTHANFYWVYSIIELNEWLNPFNLRKNDNKNSTFLAIFFLIKKK